MSKAVAETTEKYNEHLSQWTRSRDAIKGQDRIHDKGEEYLPKPAGWTNGMYTKYKKAALFYNATGRTYSAFKGLIFRKEPDINGKNIEEFLEDCTLSGTSLEEYSEKVVCEELKTSRFGVLVDHPDQTGFELSQAEAEAMGNRSYLVSYEAENILEAKTGRVGNKTVLVRVRLKEMYEVSGDDEFETKEAEQIRVLDLSIPEGVEDEKEYSGPLVYRQRIFRKEKDEKTGWAEVEKLRTYPLMDGKYIEEIPFYMVGGYDYRTPHLIDLVNANLSHYVGYADHRHGVFTANRAQFYATGVKDEELPEEMVLGGQEFWNFPNPEAEVGVAEASGNGLIPSEKLLDKLEAFMANLGARMLMPEGNESDKTATEYVIKKQGENSSLADVSKLVSQCLTKAMKFAARWMGIAEDDIEIKLNTDFIPFQATPDDLLKMIQSVQSGGYLVDDLLWWARQNEIVDPSIPDEDRKAKLETDRPPEM
ncbi:MAG: hypothetical protein CL666_08750 [Balneola sp.]|nr:hypothetical protein [Balneola sp.]|tara:strand:+ start:7927 stop:9363 length:1437 start_codon:yes stop_codon:yes gene_type:complete